MNDTPVFREVEAALMPMVRSAQRSGGLSAITVIAMKLGTLYQKKQHVDLKDVLEILDKTKQEIVERQDWING